MDRHLSAIAALCLALPLLSGCDFFRTLAGRPTSADIQAKREYIAVKQAREKRHADSVAQAARRADSLALDNRNAGEEIVVASRELAAAAGSALTSRYYVIIGSFGQRSNAEQYAAKVRGKGYETVLVPYASGLTAVGINPTDNIGEAYESVRKVSAESFAPKGVWVLVNE